MNTFEILLIVIAVVAGVIGWRRGLVMQIGQLAALVGAIIICRLFGDTVTGWFVSAFAGGEPSVTTTTIAYVVTFVAGYFAVWFLAKTATSLIKAVHLGLFNSVAGAVFKIFLWMVILSIAVNVWLLIKPSDRSSLVGEDSKDRPWREWVVDLAPKLAGAVMSMNTDELPDVSTEQE